MSNNSLAYNILIECCSSNIDVDKLNRYLDSYNNWDKLFYSANKHGVLPLVYKSLKNKNVIIPKNVLLDIKQSYISIVKNNMVISAELVRIFKLFKIHNIDAVALKGPTLSQLIFSDNTVRQYSDLDILIEKNLLYSTTEMLIQNDYKLDFSIKFLRNEKYLEVEKHIHLYNKSANVLVELHWKLSTIKNINSSFSNYYQQVMLNNQAINTFNNESLLIYLCIHGSKHFWSRLEWVVDIDRLILNNSDIDWSYIQDKVNLVNANRVFYTGLLVVNHMFKTPLPENMQNEINKNRDINLIKESIIKSLIDDIKNTKENAPLSIEANKILDILIKNKHNTFKFTLRNMYNLKPSTILLVNFPKYLSFGYYVIHLYIIIIRLLKKIKI